MSDILRTSDSVEPRRPGGLNGFALFHVVMGTMYTLELDFESSSVESVRAK